MSKTPAWASDLVAGLCPGVELNWRTNNKYQTRVTGHYYHASKDRGPFISMAVGVKAECNVQHQILIHECGHHLTAVKLGGPASRGHREAFYRVLLPMYNMLLNDEEYAQAMGREFYYKKTAQRTYEKLVTEGQVRTFTPS